MSCIATIANTVCALGFMIYVLVRESQNTVPEYIMYWPEEAFTREYFVCEAFPTVFANANQLFGFRACDIAVSWSCSRYSVAGGRIMLTRC
jgi:hypothetical protein